MPAAVRPLVAVSPAGALQDHDRLLEALQAAFDVRFCAYGGGARRADGLLVLTDGVPCDRDLEHGEDVPVFAAPAAPAVAEHTEDVLVLAEPAVDRRMHAITFAGHAAQAPLTDVSDREIVLAATASGAAWTCAHGVTVRHRVNTALPELGPQAVLRDLLDSPHVLALVALTHFLRGLARADAWAPPPVRAAMIFDDPNLRRPSYGFIDFARLVEHADAHDYHVAMAMVPLHAKRPHPATVELFRRRADRVSLVVHGNNHVKRELSSTKSAARATAIAAQALRRVQRFEARHGVRVDRVMTPPHGMCSPDAARALGVVGFDALCALHPLPWREGSPPDRLLAGWDAAEFAGPCAVIPRMPLHASAADIAMHAFLDHPVVLYGHHDDVADGFEPLQQAAERVNALGDIEWTSMSEIARSNYALRMEGDRVIVRPYAGRIRVALPDGAGELTVSAPRDAEEQFAGWSIGSTGVAAFGEAIACRGGSRVSVRLHPHDEIDPEDVSAPPFHPWPVVRQAVTELRDRMAPVIPVVPMISVLETLAPAGF